MQTFYSPLLDIAYVLLLQAFNHAPRLLAAILAVPHALAAVLVLVLARRLLPRQHAFAAAVIGVTGAAGLPTLGTAMSEMAPAACILGAVLLLARADGTEPPEQVCFAAGLLGGIAVGLKLTSAPYALGLMVVLPISGAPGRRVRRLLRFAAGGLVGAGLTGGFWWWSLWQRFGNPVFPYFNDLFRSPWGAPARMADLRFMPRSLVEALFYPLFWAFTPQTLVTELPTRDPRIALGWVAALAIAVRAARQRGPDRRAAVLPAFWALSYVAWEVCFSILRYLATLELFSGVLIVIALRPLLARLAVEWQHACSAALVLVLITVTVYPDWGASRRAGRLSRSRYRPCRRTAWWSCSTRRRWPISRCSLRPACVSLERTTISFILVTVTGWRNKSRRRYEYTPGPCGEWRCRATVRAWPIPRCALTGCGVVRGARRCVQTWTRTASWPVRCCASALERRSHLLGKACHLVLYLGVRLQADVEIQDHFVEASSFHTLEHVGDPFR